MKISHIKITLAAFLLSIGTSCTSDLDLLPRNDITSETVYKTPQGYKQGLAKVYAAAYTSTLLAEFTVSTTSENNIYPALIHALPIQLRAH